MKLPFLQSDLQASKEQERSIARNVNNVVNGIHHAARAILNRNAEDECKAKDSSRNCTTPASIQNSQTIAIILGVVIPLSCAIIVLVYLHRRHVKKQRIEDLNDPHKSLDFGMDGVEPAKGARTKRKGPEMTLTDVGGATHKRPHGLSMDLAMHMNSPYILPAGLNGSRESFHSMSRSMRDQHDPYRPVTELHRPSVDVDNDSLRFGRLNDDKGSLYSMSTGHHSALQDKAGLIANARPMSQSYGRRQDAMSPPDSTGSGDFSKPMHSAMNPSRGMPPSRQTSLDRKFPDIAEEKSLSSPPPPIIQEPEPEPQLLPPPRTTSAAPRPPRKDSMSTIHTANHRPESSNYGDDEPLPPNAITINEPEPYDIDPAAIYTGYSSDNASPEPTPALHAPQPVAGQRLSVMGLRPLPPDVPDDNPEVRANRIRSFYKEYFDDSKPNPAYAQYEDDVYSAYVDGVVYDPDTGGFFAPNKPFAQGPARRAMTPPPRSRPRVSGNSSAGPHARKLSTLSAGRPRGRSLPKKKLPPPKALTDLPTPYMMRDDSVIFNAADFAPPTTFRNLQNGSRPGSPMGMQRPYSPSVRPFTPLASSFENLAVLPSPHDLRKSGTFTALDFAPPSKIRDPMLSPSDAGSIRSNRSGMSAMQMHAVREGAYRVSRIPKELVGTQDDLALQLKPRMNLTTAA